MDAPKRFRATVKHDGESVGDLPWLEEFWAVRYDDHDAEVAELKAQIERLRKAVVELAIPLEALRITGGTALTDEIVRATDIARAVSKGDDNV